MKYNFEYMNLVNDLFETIHKHEEKTIKEMAQVFAKTIKEGNIIHVFGTGHSSIVATEMFARAGGLANVNAILDPDIVLSEGSRRASKVEKLKGLADIIYEDHNINKDDIMIIISNSGRNSVPIEMAMRTKKEGIFTIALTNLKQSKETESRHPSNKKLYELVDVILDTHVPKGDAMLSVGNITTGPGSSLACILIVNTIISEALKIVEKENSLLPVLQSQNVDGVDNDTLYAMYEDRVKHF